MKKADVMKCSNSEHEHVVVSTDLCSAFLVQTRLFNVKFWSTLTHYVSLLEGPKLIFVMKQKWLLTRVIFVFTKVP